MDKLEEIFQRQASYVRDLAPTYKHNGFEQHAQSMPWDLDGRGTQEEFRLLAWRFTEEIIESYQASHFCTVPSPSQEEHFREELADSLHFFVELCLATGVQRAELLTGMPLAPWKDHADSLEEFFRDTKSGAMIFEGDDPFFEVIRAMGLAMANLRQRPWRVDRRQTDRRRWVMGMHLVFRSFVSLCLYFKINAFQIHEAYFKKAKTNDQRVEDYGV